MEDLGNTVHRVTHTLSPILEAGNKAFLSVHLDSLFVTKPTFLIKPQKDFHHPQSLSMIQEQLEIEKYKGEK